MKYPRLLTPSAMEEIRLPSGKLLPIPKACPLFTPWTGQPVQDTYRGKPILNLDGKPVFAELAILRLFLNEGWGGVWVDTFGQKYRTSYWPKDEVTLPEEPQNSLNRISEKAGAKKGCWDVFLWKDGLCLFAESKWKQHDQIRSTQLKWLEAAIECGLTPASFLIVEWSV